MRPSGLLVVASLVSLLLAGCVANDGGLHAATTSGTPVRQAAACPTGSYVRAIAADGSPACDVPLASFRCPGDQFVNGVGADGVPQCAPLPQRALRDPCEPASTTSSNFRALNVYGTRPDARSDVDHLKINVEASAGAPARYVPDFLVCYKVGPSATPYSKGLGEPKTFTLTWIRGEKGDYVHAGDLVEIALGIAPLPTRTEVALWLVPGDGSIQHADFLSPTTYGTDTVITLR